MTILSWALTPLSHSVGQCVGKAFRNPIFHCDTLVTGGVWENGNGFRLAKLKGLFQARLVYALSARRLTCCRWLAHTHTQTRRHTFNIIFIRKVYFSYHHRKRHSHCLSLAGTVRGGRRASTELASLVCAVFGRKQSNDNGPTCNPLRLARSKPVENVVENWCAVRHTFRRAS